MTILASGGNSKSASKVDSSCTMSKLFSPHRRSITRCISREWVVQTSYGTREASERSCLARFPATPRFSRWTISTGNSCRRRSTFSSPGAA